MPDFCSAYGCSNERTKRLREKGITFHRFPLDPVRRKAWTLALWRDGFEPQARSLLCSCHFRPEDFDRTGQTVRLRDGAIPTIFDFPRDLSKSQSFRSSRTRLKAASEKHPPTIEKPPPTIEKCPTPIYKRLTPIYKRPPSIDPPLRLHTPARGPDPYQPVEADHPYALDPAKAKQKLTESQEQLKKLRQELRNARDRERKHKETVRSLMEDLKKKNILTEELQEKLDFYSDLPVELLKHEHAFNPRQKEFALTLHLHGPKVYNYLRDTVKIPLPHPHTLLKWLQTVDSQDGLQNSEK